MEKTGQIYLTEGDLSATEAYLRRMEDVFADDPVSLARIANIRKQNAEKTGQEFETVEKTGQQKTGHKKPVKNLDSLSRFEKVVGIVVALLLLVALDALPVLVIWALLALLGVWNTPVVLWGLFIGLLTRKAVLLGDRKK